jgi:molybdopterin-guanine dinucleotide biosynthesis protein
MKLAFSLAILLAMTTAQAQTKTTDALQKEVEATVFAFYKNTLRMINQTESKEFDDLVKDIEKMKLLMIDKAVNNFGIDKVKGLVSGYKKEGYEAIVTSRHEGRSFDVYMKDKAGKTVGTVVLVNDATDLYVLDILGSVPVSKIPEFFSTLDASSELGKKIKEFADKADDNRGEGQQKKNDNQ